VCGSTFTLNLDKTEKFFVFQEFDAQEVLADVLVELEDVVDGVAVEFGELGYGIRDVEPVEELLHVRRDHALVLSWGWWRFFRKKRRHWLQWRWCLHGDGCVVDDRLDERCFVVVEDRRYLVVDDEGEGWFVGDAGLFERCFLVVSSLRRR